MARAVISGGTGFVGRFIVEEFLSQGYDVTVIGQNEPTADFFSSPVRFIAAGLGQNFNYQAIMDEAQAYVFAALDRDKDRKNYVFKNLGGAAALFRQAKKAGVSRAVFISSQSVYGPGEPGMEFYESDDPNPTTLDGKVKFETEKSLMAMTDEGFAVSTLRLARVYGPPGLRKGHKWDPLFRAYMSGKLIKPFAASQIHGEDAARAVTELVRAPSERVSGGIFNAADLIIDRTDILAPLQSALARKIPLPAQAAREGITSMNCDKMKRFEWRTGGKVKLSMTLERMIKPYVQAA